MLGPQKPDPPAPQDRLGSRSPPVHYNTFYCVQQTPEQLLNSSLIYTSRDEASGIESWLHLQQLQWLGFDYEQRDNLTAITQFVSSIVPK